MRVALDATYSVEPQPSGIAVYSRKLLHGLAASHPGDQFLHCYRPKQLRHSSRPAEANVSRRLLAPRLAQWLPMFHADLFHSLNQRVDTRPAKKVVSTFHDLFVMTGHYSSTAFQKRFTAQARQAAENSDLIITVSNFTAGQVVTLLKVDRSRIRVIPHGVCLPTPREPASPEKLILFVGALQVRKNIVRLVEAFEAARLDADWRLVLAGSPTGFGAEGILQRIETSPCRGRIEVAGYVSEDVLERLYQRAAIFAFPSLDEGFGMPVLEAMQRGLPVITSNSSALSEVAAGAALMVDPHNTEQIAGAMTQIALDPELRETLIELGRDRARSYPWRRAIDATYGVYTELLG